MADEHVTWQELEPTAHVPLEQVAEQLPVHPAAQEPPVPPEFADPSAHPLIVVAAQGVVQAFDNASQVPFEQE